MRWPAARAAALGLYFAHPCQLSAQEASRTVRGFAGAAGLPAILPCSRHYRFQDSAFQDSTGVCQDAITIAWGDNDRVLIGGQAEGAQALPPPARHIRVSGSGHVPMSDSPDHVADLILRR